MTIDDRNNEHTTLMRRHGTPVGGSVGQTDLSPLDGLKRRPQNEDFLNYRFVSPEPPLSSAKYIQRAHWQDSLTYYHKRIVLHKIRLAGILIRRSGECSTFMILSHLRSSDKVKIGCRGFRNPTGDGSCHKMVLPPVATGVSAAQPCGIDGSDASIQADDSVAFRFVEGACDRLVKKSLEPQENWLLGQRRSTCGGIQAVAFRGSAQQQESETWTGCPTHKRSDEDRLRNRPTWFLIGSSLVTLVTSTTWSSRGNSVGCGSGSSDSVTGRGETSTKPVFGYSGGKTQHGRLGLKFVSRKGRKAQDSWLAKFHEQQMGDGGTWMEMVFFEGIQS